MTHGGIPLRAALVPKQPLCLYIYGAAGCGKSSFVRALLPALARTIRAWIHPALDSGFVKQGLNKSSSALALEFERRPNNNDLSVGKTLLTQAVPIPAPCIARRVEGVGGRRNELVAMVQDSAERWAA